MIAFENTHTHQRISNDAVLPYDRVGLGCMWKTLQHLLYLWYSVLLALMSPVALVLGQTVVVCSSLSYECRLSRNGSEVAWIILVP